MTGLGRSLAIKKVGVQKDLQANYLHILTSLFAILALRMIVEWLGWHHVPCVRPLAAVQDMCRSVDLAEIPCSVSMATTKGTTLKSSTATSDHYAIVAPGIITPPS